MIKHKNCAKLPYRTPDTALPDIILEQTITADSANETLEDMGVTDIFDDAFSPIN